MSLLESWQSSPPPPLPDPHLPLPLQPPSPSSTPLLKGLPAMTAKKKKLAIRSNEELSDQMPACARKAVDPVIKFVFCDLFRRPPPFLAALGWGVQGPL